MLKIVIPGWEKFDETTSRIISVPDKELRLEHSLISISKWESKWKKPFLAKENMTMEETVDYVRCMTITQNVDPDVYNHMSVDNIMKVKAYISDPMTATWFSNRQQKTAGVSSVITSELIYWQMIALEIPFECQTWHLNRLLTLIRICAEKQKPDKKMSKSALMKRNRSLNAARKAKLGSRG